MLAICLIYKMADHKHDSYFYTDGLIYHENLQNRL
jgi:hypothetical protein